MDVELRMIRQKNMEMDLASKDVQNIPEDVKVEQFDDDVVYSNQRSKAFSHIESMMKDPSPLNDVEKVSVSSKKVIDMEIIDRIKNMRSKSRDSKQPQVIGQNSAPIN